MKKNILYLTLTFALSLLIIPNVLAASNEEAQIGDTKYSLQDALKQVTDGQTIKLIDDINSSENFERNESAAINFTFDLNGHTIISSSDLFTFSINDGSTVTIKDSSSNGTIKNTGGARALWLQKGKVTIKGGNFITENTSSKTTTIEVGIESFTSEYDNNSLIIENAVIKGSGHGVVLASNNVNFEMKGGSIDCEQSAIATFNASSYTNIFISGGSIKGATGVGIIGKNGTVNITGGNINVTGVGINSNNSSKNMNINITGGNIEGSVGIYKPQSGTLSISGGTITGKIGVVARQGAVEITGGIIKGTGTPGESHKVGDMNHDLPNGVAVIVDNESKNYGSDITVVIKGGTFESQYKQAIYSFSGDDDIDDFQISGGSYNHPFTPGFVVDGSMELNIQRNGDNKWYVGKDAMDAVNDVIKDGDAIIDIIQGDLNITGVSSGVTVKNSGNGEVIVNGNLVKTNSEIVVKDNSTNEEIQNPNTYDNILIYVLLLMISLGGTIYIVKRIKA